MNNETNLKLTHTAAAWYRDSVLKNVPYTDNISISDEHGREMNIEYIDLNGRSHPRIALFDDAWSLLFSNPELMELFATLEKKSPAPAALKAALITLGITDITPTKP